MKIYKLTDCRTLSKAINIALLALFLPLSFGNTNILFADITKVSNNTLAPSSSLEQDTPSPGSASKAKEISLGDEIPQFWLEAALGEIDTSDFPGTQRIADLLIKVSLTDASIDDLPFKRIRYAKGLDSLAEVFRHPQSGEIFFLLDENLKDFFPDSKEKVAFLEPDQRAKDRKLKACFLASQLIHATVRLMGETSIHWNRDTDPSRINMEFAAFFGELSFLHSHPEKSNFLKEITALLPGPLQNHPLLSLYSQVASYSEKSDFIENVFCDLGNSNPIIKHFEKRKHPEQLNYLDESTASLFILMSELFKQGAIRNYYLGMYEVFFGDLLQTLTGKRQGSILELLKNFDTPHWADWGSGEGEALNQLSRHLETKQLHQLGIKLTGVDIISPRDLHPGASFLHSDIQETKLPEKADLITMLFVYAFTYDPIKVIVNAYNNLNENGVLLLEACTSLNLSTDAVLPTLIPEVVKELQKLGIDCFYIMRSLYIRKGPAYLRSNLQLANIRRILGHESKYVTFAHTYQKKDPDQPMLIPSDLPPTESEPAPFIFPFVDALPLTVPFQTAVEEAGEHTNERVLHIFPTAVASDQSV